MKVEMNKKSQIINQSIKISQSTIEYTSRLDQLAIRGSQFGTSFRNSQRGDVSTRA